MFYLYLKTDKYISRAEIDRHGIYPSELARKAGFENGDRIAAINGQDYNEFNNLLDAKEGTIYSIFRNGKTVKLSIDKNLADEIRNTRNGLFLYLSVPFEIETVLPDSPAEACGLQKGDKIKKVNGKDIIKQFELTDEISKDEDKVVDLEIERLVENQIKLVSTVVNVASDNRLGFTTTEPIQYSFRKNSLLECVGQGIKKANVFAFTNVEGFTKLFAGSVKSSDLGPIYISESSGNEYQGERFWTLFAALAMLGCFYNLLPIPGSVFWQTIPLLYEGVFRKGFSINYYNRLRSFSYAIVIVAMVLIIGMDIFKLIF